MFSDHLFTFALSRLTERCYLFPAPTLLFGWVKYTKRIFDKQYNSYTNFLVDT